MKRHEMVFQFICDYKTCSDGNSPSIRKIGQACKMFTSLVVYYLGKLVDLELIRVEEGKIHVIGGAWRFVPDLLDMPVDGITIESAHIKERSRKVLSTPTRT